MGEFQIDIKTIETIIEDMNAMYKKYIDVIENDESMSEQQKEDYVAELITVSCVNFMQVTNHIKNQIKSDFPIPEMSLLFNPAGKNLSIHELL